MCPFFPQPKKSTEHKTPLNGLNALVPSHVLWLPISLVRHVHIMLIIAFCVSVLFFCPQSLISSGAHHNNDNNDSSHAFGHVHTLYGQMY